MKKLFIFAVMAIVLVSCNQNAPEQDPALLGKWSSKDSTNIEMTFNSDHPHPETGDLSPYCLQDYSETSPS